MHFSPSSASYMVLFARCVVFRLELQYSFNGAWKGVWPFPLTIKGTGLHAKYAAATNAHRPHNS